MVGIGSSCGACKFLRRKCGVVCIFAPYFSYDQSEVDFAAVHKVFGASNVSKLLSHLPMFHRSAAAFTLTYEAQARIHDPVRGCVSHILALHHQVGSLQMEIDALTTQLADSSTDPGSSSLQPLMEYAEKFEVCKQRGIQEAYTSIRAQNPQVDYKDAIDQLEHCLFSDEPSLWEEMSISALDEGLGHATASF